jgi:hypothetical protein
MAGKMNVYNEMVKAQLESISADPTGIIGMVYFNTTSNISKYYNGSAWKTFLAADFSNVTGTLAVANGGTGVTTSTGTGSVVLSNSPTLVTPALGTPSSGTLTNTTGLPIDGGTINTLPINRGGTGQTSQTAAFDALAPTTTTGDISYHNGTDNVRLPIGTDGQALKVSGGIPAWGDGGAGAGEINAILNPSAASATTGWSDDANHSKTRLTSGSPLDPVITTAFRFTKDNTNVSTESSTSGVYYPFTLPTGLESKKLKVEFYCIVPATGVWKVSVYDGTTRLALSTDSSGATILPAGFTGKFVTYFDATANNSYTVSFTETSGVATNLDATNIIVGPGIQPQGAVIEEWKAFTPTSNFTNCTHTGFYRRIGDSMQIAARGVFTSAPAAISQFSLNLPTGFTLDTSKTPSGATSNAVGSAYARDSGVADYIGTVFTSGTALTVTGGAGASDGWDEGRPFAWAINDSWSINAIVPVSEWAGSGTVNLAQNDVEYTYNTGTWDADDDTSFGYGPNGQQITTSTDLTTRRTKRVRFQTPIQATDIVQLQFQISGNWISHPWYLRDTGYPISELSLGATTANVDTYGVAIQTINSNNTEVLVSFGRYCTRYNNATNVGWSTAIGSSVIRWRVVKYAGGQAVGFGMATSTQSGLVSRQVTTTSFTPGYTFTGSLGTSSSTNASGSYSRIGNLVYFSLRIDIIKGTATGNLRLTGLPISSSSTATSSYSSFATESLSGLGAGEVVYGQITQSTTTLNMLLYGAGAAADVAVGDMGATTSFRCSGFYFVD